MNKNEYQINPYNQKLIYESIKQDILSLANIKSKYNDIIKKNNLINPKLLLKCEKNIKKKENKKKISSKHPSSLIDIEKKIYKKFHDIYSLNKDFYNIKIINEIICNENSHIVAEFKDFLIKDDYSEFIQKYYYKKDINDLLKQIFEYYKLSSVVYPNYILLTEKKYIYRNIQKKQKLIDDQQQQEEKINDVEKKISNWTERLKPSNSSELVFDSNIIDSILNQSNTSQIVKFVFGVSNENSVDIDDKNLYNIVKNINNAEENYYNNFLAKNKLIGEKSKNANNNKKNEKIIPKNKEKKDKEKDKEKEKNKENNNNIYHKNIIKQEQNTTIKNNPPNNKRNENKVTQKFVDFSEFGKTHTNFTSNLTNIKNKNNKEKKDKKVYSLYVNKDKDKERNDIKINKTPLNDNRNLTITERVMNKNKKYSNNNLNINNNKEKYQGRNYQLNLLEPMSTNELYGLQKLFKSDLNININHNNIIINENNNYYLKNSKNNSNDKEKKDKSNKNNKKSLVLELTEKQLNEKKNNNKYIRKTVINELLSLCPLSKDILRTSKFTESQREINHSNNKSERGKQNKFISNQKMTKNKKRISNIIIENNHNYSFLNSVSKEKNLSKKNKGTSLDIELKNDNNKNYFKTGQSMILINRTKNNHKKNSVVDKNINIINKDIVSTKKDDDASDFSKNFINSSVKKDSRRNIIYCKDESARTITGKKSSNNTLVNRNNIYYKKSRNKENLYIQDLTYAMINMKRYLNTTNSIYSSNYTNIGGNKKYSNNNILYPHKTKSSISTSLKERLKLNFDYLRHKDNIYKKKENIQKSVITKKDSANRYIGKSIITNCSNMNNNKKSKDLYPLSARELIITDNHFINNKNINNRNSIGVLRKNNNKYKPKNLKNSLNEIGVKNNSTLFSYTNSYKNKNKFIKKTQTNNNPNLILSNLINKKADTKKINNCTMPEINSRNKNKKIISSSHHNNPISTKNNSEINSFLINNFNCSTNTNNNIDINTYSNDLTTTIIKNTNNNNNNNSNLICTPNIKKKSDGKINEGIKKDKIVTNRSINNKTSKYFYNEVNINNTIEKKNNYIHDSNSNDKINHNIIRQHTKINSSPFSSINMNNNINNHTNYYYANNNSIINVKTNKDKYSNIQSKNYKYKRINNIKNNIKDMKINKIDKLHLMNNKNYNFFPLTLTDRNKQDNIFSSINSYSINIPNKNKK